MSFLVDRLEVNNQVNACTHTFMRLSLLLMHASVVFASKYFFINFSTNISGIRPTCE